MTIDELRILISKDESRCLELKKTTGELKDAMHTLCAMMNSDGGHVIIGVSPSTLAIQGQFVSDKTRQEIAIELRKIEPYINMPVEYIDVGEDGVKQVIVFHVDKHIYTDSPYVYNGKAYYKLESTTMTMPQPMYEDMLRRRDMETFRWDVQKAKGMTIGDLSETRIRAAVALGVKNGRLRASAEGESLDTLLEKLKLLRDGSPTHAAMVLFAENLDNYPEFELRMACFKGLHKNIFIDNKSETGNFFDLLDAGIAFCFRNLRMSGEVKGLLREEKLEIPLEALREALTNALCHRQYERTNGSVSLAIYDDRVEITNPGRFPAQLSPEKIKLPHESYPYNKLIAQVLYLTTYLEKWGSGAERIIQLCHNQDLPEPEWRNEDNSVSIIFKRPKPGTFLGDKSGQTGGQTGGQAGGQTGGQTRVSIDPDSTTGKILHLLIENPRITRKVLSETIMVSHSAIQKHIDKLKRAGIIHREGGRFGGIWVINEKNN